MVGPSLPLQLSFPRALRRHIALLSVCVAMSCGGGFPPGGVSDSVWDSVKPMTGNFFFYLFPVPEFVVCMHAEFLVQQQRRILR